MNAADSLNDVIYRLGFADLADLDTAGRWVTVDELYQWMDDAAKKVAYKAGLFTRWNDAITVTPGTALYDLPADHVFTIAAWLDNSPLRITPVRDLWALDGTWPATSGPAKRCSMDAGSVGTITLYPNPTVGGTLGQVCQEYPSTVSQARPSIPVPTVLQDYFSYAALAGARGKESEAAMPEMAKHFAARCELYEQIIQHLWGPGQ